MTLRQIMGFFFGSLAVASWISGFVLTGTAVMSPEVIEFVIGVSILIRDAIAVSLEARTAFIGVLALSFAVAFTFAAREAFIGDE